MGVSCSLEKVNGFIKSKPSLVAIDWYKTRLVARGFTQEYGIDCEETFVPVACLTFIRTLFTISAA